LLFFHINSRYLHTLTAILCFTAFFALQYGKLISYWHCRIVSISSAAPCDCVQQLLDTHKDDAKHATATLKEKTEDVVLFYEPVQQTNTVDITCTAYPMAHTYAIPQTSTGSVFQPPRV
jgi:hypothetical protein